MFLKLNDAIIYIFTYEFKVLYNFNPYIIDKYYKMFNLLIY